MARRSTLFSAVSTLGAILILAAGCSDGMPTATQIDEVKVTEPGVALGRLAPPNIINAAVGHTGGSFEAVIGAEGGTLEFEGGSLTFPAGALAADTKITVDVHATKMAVVFGPHGAQFPADAQPELRMDLTGVTGINGQGLTVLYLGEDGRVVENVGGAVDTEENAFTVNLGHFSAYVIATG